MSTQSNNNKRIAKNMRNHLLRLLPQVTRLLQKEEKSIGQVFYSHRLSEEQAIYDCSYLSYAS